MKHITAFFAALVFSTGAVAATITGSYSHEVESGLNKTCYYNTSRGLMAFTTEAVYTCPLQKTFYI